MEVDLKMPVRTDAHRFWVAAYSDQGGCGVHEFKLKIVDKKEK